MKEKLTFLGIETSCDETAASVVREKADGTGEILSNVVSSQIEEHKEFGGVVPEIAARAHVEKIEFIIKKAIKGFFKDPAIAFPTFKPTVKQTIRPGPAVADIPFILLKFKLLSSMALLIMYSIFST